MKKLLPIFVLFAVLLPASAHAEALVEFERTDYDFGTVKQGVQLRHEFRFVNAGDADLVIEGINPS